MILVTVGHQMPFDRLVRAVDAWAATRARAGLFAQIGEGLFWPSHFQAVPFLTPQQFEQRVARATAIVSHAGTGTIIAALEHGKPLLVLPRRAELGETRNDHQLATARHFEAGGHVLVAWDEDELPEKLDVLESFRPAGLTANGAAERLVERIRGFIFEP